MKYLVEYDLEKSARNITMKQYRSYIRSNIEVKRNGMKYKPPAYLKRKVIYIEVIVVALKLISASCPLWMRTILVPLCTWYLSNSGEKRSFLCPIFCRDWPDGKSMLGIVAHRFIRPLRFATAASFPEDRYSPW